MASPKLHVAGSGDIPPDPPEPSFSSVLEATERGSRLDALIQTRRVIARALDSSATSATALAALTLRLDAISERIEAMKAQSKDDGEGNGGSVGRRSFDAAAI